MNRRSGFARESAEKVWAERKKKAPPTFTAAELLAEELPPLRWAVPGILPEGVSIIAGKPKIGKSWLTGGLCIAVASGGVALGKKPVEQGAVLWLALEDNKRRMQSRIKKMLAGGGPAPSKLEIQVEWPRLDEGGLEALERWLTDHPDARLIVVDTLKKIRPRAATNRGIYDLDYEALEPLLPLAAEHGVSILVVHHTRKLIAADPLDELSGSTGLSGGVDGALILKRDRGQADAYLHVTGRDVEEDGEFALSWDAAIAVWTLMGDADEYRQVDNHRKIIAVLQQAGQPLGPRQISERTGIAYDTTRTTLGRMLQQGSIISPSRGKYACEHTSVHNVHNAHNASSHRFVNTSNGRVHNSGAQMPIDIGNAENVNIVNKDSGGDVPRQAEPRMLNEEEEQEVQKLVSQGMALRFARAEVVGEE